MIVCGGDFQCCVVLFMCGKTAEPPGKKNVICLPFCLYTNIPCKYKSKMLTKSKIRLLTIDKIEKSDRERI